MTSSKNAEVGELQARQRRERFAKAINRQGFAFQSRVVDELHQLVEKSSSQWSLAAIEFPVQAGKFGTRIDFVLEAHRSPYWLVGECKRVNPAFSEWFFLKAPHVRRDHEERYVVEEIHLHHHEMFARGVSLRAGREELMFHTAYAAPIDAKGDGPPGHNAVEDAAGQACKGMNGLANLLKSNRGLLGEQNKRIVVPVIFTTANLFSCELPVAQVDLPSGEVAPEKLNVVAQPFVFYQYHLSPELAHDVMRVGAAPGLSPLLADAFIRTIAIVNASGIETFFKAFNPDRFTVHPLP